MHYEKVGDSEPVCIEDELPFELPDGWSWARLKSLYLVQLGKMLDKQKNEGNKKPYLRNANVQWRSFNLSDIGTMRFADNELNTFRLCEGDLVICEGGQPGRCAIWQGNTEIYFQKALERVRGVCSKSSIWWLLNVVEAYSDTGFLQGYFTGTTIKHLPARALESLLIPIPPLAEQCRIVTVLNEYLGLVDDIDRSQAELDELLEKTRSKVLDLAIRGKLVPQDPADEPASVLLERIHQEKLQMVADGKLKKKDVAGDSVIYRGEDNSYYERCYGGEASCINEGLPFSLPSGWCWCRLSMLASASGGKTPPTSNPFFWEGGTVPWVTSKDMKSPVLWSSQIMMTETASKSMAAVPPNSVLIVTRSGILRRAFPVAINMMETTVNQDIKALVPYVSGITWQIYLAFVGQEQRILAKFSKDGTTVESIDFDRLYQMLIPVPPLSEQKRINAAVERLLSANLLAG